MTELSQPLQAPVFVMPTDGLLTRAHLRALILHARSHGATLLQMLADEKPKAQPASVFRNGFCTPIRMDSMWVFHRELFSQTPSANGSFFLQRFSAQDDHGVPFVFLATRVSGLKDQQPCFEIAVFFEGARHFEKVGEEPPILRWE